MMDYRRVLWDSLRVWDRPGDGNTPVPVDLDPSSSFRHAVISF